MRIKKYLVFVIALIVLSMLSCEVPYHFTVTTRLTPPLITRPGMPGPGYVWIQGDWFWNGHAYIWRDGYWALPADGIIWMPGEWKRKSKGWYWRPGHWRRR